MQFYGRLLGECNAVLFRVNFVEKQIRVCPRQLPVKTITRWQRPCTACFATTRPRVQAKVQFLWAGSRVGVIRRLLLPETASQPASAAAVGGGRPPIREDGWTLPFPRRPRRRMGEARGSFRRHTIPWINPRKPLAWASKYYSFVAAKETVVPDQTTALSPAAGHCCPATGKGATEIIGRVVIIQQRFWLEGPPAITGVLCARSLFVSAGCFTTPRTGDRGRHTAGA
jgi:hypothetical protein